MANITKPYSVDTVIGELNTSGGGGVGAGQTWQVVTTSRVVNTVYTNSTGKPIQVSVSPNGWNDRYIGFDGYVNNVRICTSIGYGGNSKPQLTFIVPNGMTYKVAYASGVETSGINIWSELR